VLGVVGGVAAATATGFRMDVTQQKLAEKLTLLNDRGQGLLTRLYNIKKVGGSWLNCN